MQSGFFNRLRERQEQREVEKARREGFEAGRRHAEIIGRVQQAQRLRSLHTRQRLRKWFQSNSSSGFSNSAAGLLPQL